MTQANGQVTEILDPDSRHLARYRRAGTPSAALQELGTWKSESMVLRFAQFALEQSR